MVHDFKSRVRLAFLLLSLNLIVGALTGQERICNCSEKDIIAEEREVKEVRI